MTRKETLKIAMGLRTDFKCESDTMVDFCNTIIKVLEQEPCEDAISRQAVLGYIHRILNQGTGKKKSFEFIQKYVEKLPPVTPQPKMGHWIEDEQQIHVVKTYHCSECGCDVWYDDTTKFCSSCGAKMDNWYDPESEEE